MFVYSSPIKSKGYNNDCFPRAMHNLGFDYQEVREEIKKCYKKYGYRYTKRSPMYTRFIFEVLSILTERYDKKIVIPGLFSTFIGRVTEFAKTHKRGKYLMDVKGHSFAIIDGKIHDTGCDYKNDLVINYFKIKDRNIIDKILDSAENFIDSICDSIEIYVDKFIRYFTK